MANWSAIFDWDGVIVDSSRAHEEAWHRTAHEVNRPVPPEFFRRSFGMKNDKVIRELLGWTKDPQEIARLSFRKEAIFREIIVAHQKLEPLPGVLNLLKALRTEEIRCAVASSTPRANIDCVIETIGLSSYFEALICAEDVTHGKPDPEVFLLAAAKLEANPARCVVFEDAHVGIEAARKAGMKVVAVSTTHPAHTLNDADKVVSGLDALKPADLDAWFV
jgi:beta-phosphoglucomutase family hydrolase